MRARLLRRAAVAPLRDRRVRMVRRRQAGRASPEERSPARRSTARRVPDARTTAARRARQRARPDTALPPVSTFSPRERGRLRRGRSSRARLPAVTCRCRLRPRRMQSIRFHAPRVPKLRGAARFPRCDPQNRAARATHLVAAIHPRFPRASRPVRHRPESRRAVRAFPPSAPRRTLLSSVGRSGRTRPARPGVRRHRSARPSCSEPRPRAIRRARAVVPQMQSPSRNLSSLVSRQYVRQAHRRIVRASAPVRQRPNLHSGPQDSHRDRR